MQNTDNNKCRQDVEKWEFLPLSVVMQNAMTSLEDSLAISYKAKQSYHMI